VKWSIGIGRIAGIRIELHVTFVLFVVWLAGVQGMAAGDVNRALAAGALLLLLFGCVLLHELGHALAARRYGIRTRSIVLLPIGGVANLERMPDNPRHEIVVALAGPAVNVVIAGALFGLLVLLRQPALELSFGGGLLASLLFVNVVMVLFNLIPAFPMDGGRVLRALLALRLPYVRATRIAATVGQSAAVLFALWSIFNGPPTLLIVALFVFFAAGAEQAAVQARHQLSGLPVRAAMVTQFDVLDAAQPLQLARERLLAGSQQEFPVAEGGTIVGVLGRADLVRGLEAGGPDLPIGRAVARGGDAADPNEPLEAALTRMRERRLGALPVVSGGLLVGLLTIENVSELLLMQDALEKRRPS
jgi:stage IV sporulation protein FB